MVALVASFIVTFAGVGLFVWWGHRRPVGALLTWGEAIAASTYAFFLMFWAYGVVPHQWLTYANNELQWTPTKGLVGPGGILDEVLPFSLNYEKLRDLVVVGIYGLFLAINVWAFIWWQNRGKRQPPAIDTSTFGRPLVRRGG